MIVGGPMNLNGSSDTMLKFGVQRILKQLVCEVNITPTYKYMFRQSFIRCEILLTTTNISHNQRHLNTHICVNI